MMRRMERREKERRIRRLDLGSLSSEQDANGNGNGGGGEGDGEASLCIFFDLGFGEVINQHAFLLSSFLYLSHLPYVHHYLLLYLVFGIWYLPLQPPYMKEITLSTLY